ncbi:MAG: nucleotide sugar dehydrogenase [archaeon]
MKICVVGLGYVGLPLALSLARHYPLVGFDINSARVNDLKAGVDSLGELSSSELKTNARFTSDPSEIRGCGFIIIAVPTPITKSRKPDLTILEDACRVVGANLGRGAIIVIESTVYPGVTEEVCAPIIEEASGMKCGKDFKVGYSPERINPGDTEHTVENVVKVVSGMDEETLDAVAAVYSSVVRAGVHRASSIKTAEAAKAIENIQRDLNIALMNELSLIFERLGLDTREVIEAAGTKWNFHKYYPGLIGGHCIPVDPYYLTFKAEEMGYNPRVILAGRDINEYMSRHVCDLVVKSLNAVQKVPARSRVLILGLSFKENVSDTRNSKAKDLIAHLKGYDIEVLGHDPRLSDEAVRMFGTEKVNPDLVEGVDAVIVFSPHDEFRDLSLRRLKEICNERPVMIDLKAFYDAKEAGELGFLYRRL